MIESSWFLFRGLYQVLSETGTHWRNRSSIKKDVVEHLWWSLSMLVRLKTWAELSPAPSLSCSYQCSSLISVILLPVSSEGWYKLTALALRAFSLPDTFVRLLIKSINHFRSPPPDCLLFPYLSWRVRWNRSASTCRERETDLMLVWGWSWMAQWSQKPGAVRPPWSLLSDLSSCLCVPLFLLFTISIPFIPGGLL